MSTQLLQFLFRTLCPHAYLCPQSTFLSCNKTLLNLKSYCYLKLFCDFRVSHTEDSVKFKNFASLLLNKEDIDG
jgi:hypothetical protein